MQQLDNCLSIFPFSFSNKVDRGLIGWRCIGDSCYMSCRSFCKLQTNILTQRIIMTMMITIEICILQMII